MCFKWEHSVEYLERLVLTKQKMPIYFFAPFSFQIIHSGRVVSILTMTKWENRENDIACNISSVIPENYLLFNDDDGQNLTPKKRWDGISSWYFFFKKYCDVLIYVNVSNCFWKVGTLQASIYINIIGIYLDIPL